MKSTKQRAASKRWKERNPEYSAKYYRKHRKKLLARQRRYRIAHWTKQCAYLRKRGRDDRRKFIAGRKLCDLCGRTCRPILDHSHATAKRRCSHQPHRHCNVCRRGVLCSRCNTGLGMFQDNTRLLKKAIRYIQDWRIKH